ncbi:hypothetical protein [Pimelobacter simplex]|uniref:hypothetical protein n=1 Tax=Nocardioides simplex TaxID=2045 RepID=UPI003AACD9C2
MKQSKSAHRAEPSRSVAAGLVVVVGALVVVVGVLVVRLVVAGEDTASSGAEVRIQRPEVADAEPADRALIEFSCAAGRDGAWTATGTVLNTAPRRTDYVVTALVVDDAGATVGGRATLVTLGPGRSAGVDLTDLYHGRAAACRSEVVRSGGGS